MYKREQARHRTLYIVAFRGTRVRIFHGSFVYSYLAYVFPVLSSWTSPIAKERETGGYDTLLSANNCELLRTRSGARRQWR